MHHGTARHGTIGTAPTSNQITFQRPKRSTAYRGNAPAKPHQRRSMPRHQRAIRALGGAHEEPRHGTAPAARHGTAPAGDQITLRRPKPLPRAAHHDTAPGAQHQRCGTAPRRPITSWRPVHCGMARHNAAPLFVRHLVHVMQVKTARRPRVSPGFAGSARTNPTSPLGREWFRSHPLPFFPSPFFPFGEGLSLFPINKHPLPQATGCQPGPMTTP